jgi:hypothetical protein
MFVDIARLLALVFCMLSLCAVFHTAFLVPASDLEQRIGDSLSLLALAAAISLVGGLVFRDAIPEPHPANSRLTATLPVQLFCWASSIMFVLFIVSWYLESHCVFYRDIRF